MFNNLNRRDFFRGVTVATIALITKDLLFCSPASADTYSPNNQSGIQEKYLVFVPYNVAKEGGKISEKT